MLLLSKAPKEQRDQPYIYIISIINNYLCLFPQIKKAYVISYK